MIVRVDSMTERQREIAEALIRLLFVQGGDCRARDFVVDDLTVAELLDEYENCNVGVRDSASGTGANGEA